MLASLVQGNFIPLTKILLVMIMCSHLEYFILILSSCLLAYIVVFVDIFDSSPVCFVTLVPENVTYLVSYTLSTSLLHFCVS